MSFASLFDPMALAYDPSRWCVDDLDKIANAMQGWRGTGHCDDLDGRRLRDHMYRKHLGAPNKKGNAPPRWRAWSIVLVW